MNEVKQSGVSALVAGEKTQLSTTSSQNLGRTFWSNPVFTPSLCHELYYEEIDLVCLSPAGPAFMHWYVGVRVKEGTLSRI